MKKERFFEIWIKEFQNDILIKVEFEEDRTKVSIGEKYTFHPVITFALQIVNEIKELCRLLGIKVTW